MIDIQEKFRDVIFNFEHVLKNASILKQASIVLNIPLIVTEQYPKGLGTTVSELSEGIKPIEKIKFDCYDIVKDQLDDEIVIFGIESHVCVLQTALSVLAHNKKVYVIADAVSSRKKENKEIALRQLENTGVIITSTESILFQILKKAGTDEFRVISKLIK